MSKYENIKREDIKTTIKLTDTVNTRHIGGYKGKNGRFTDEKAFIRSDVPSSITNEDILMLIDMGLETVIDLRTQDEMEGHPVPFAELAEVAYVTVPLVPDETPPHLMNIGNLGDLYIHILEERKPYIAETLRMITKTDGMVFFNCSAGKDRTGTIAMLLLKLAGVSNEDIVMDYYFTEILLQPWIEAVVPKLEEEGVNFNMKMLEALPEYMEKAVNFLDENYESMEAYMESIGLTESEINKLIEKTLK